MRPLSRFILLLALWPATAFAQQTGGGIYLHGGWIWAHTKTMRHLVTGYVPSVEFQIHRTAAASKNWLAYFRLPSRGISVTLQNLQNPLTGAAIIVLPYIDFRPFGNRSSFYFRTGTGLAFVTRPFHRDDNFRNTAIGSRLNGSVQFIAGLRQPLGEKLHGDFGLAFTHYSNGAAGLPNLGINVPSLKVGLTWNPASRENTVQFVSDSIRTTSLFLTAAAGVQAVLLGDNSPYWVTHLSADLRRKTSFSSTWILAADLFYHESLQKGLLSADRSRINPFRAGVSGYYRLQVHRFAYQAGMGIYLLPGYTGDGLLYHRLGVRYRVSNKLEANITLHTHFAVADHFDVGLSYRLR